MISPAPPRTAHRVRLPERLGACAPHGPPQPVARKQDERVCGFVLVVPLALEKRLFLNAPRKRLLVPLLGKKYCDINKRLNPERFRSTPRTCGPFRGMLSVR
jgi:hypothetical protein